MKKKKGTQHTDRVEGMFGFLDRVEKNMRIAEKAIQLQTSALTQINSQIDRLIVALRLDPGLVREEAKKRNCSIGEVIALKLGFTQSEFQILVKR